METRWMYTTSENFDALLEASKGVCVIPMGCLEKHGLHLPVGTDIMQTSAIVYEASQMEPFCVFPDFVFGNQGTPLSNAPKGTVALTGDLMLEMMGQLCDQIARSGFHKILICNGHGGNRVLISHFSSHLADRKKPDYVFASYYISADGCPLGMGQILEKEGPGSIPELTPEDEELILKYYKGNMLHGHAGMGETALMMGAAPETVHLERLGIESGIPLTLSKPYAEVGLSDYGAWGMNTPNWFEGDDPIGCNERMGKAAVRLEAEGLARAVRLLKEDTFLEERRRNFYR